MCGTRSKAGLRISRPTFRKETVHWEVETILISKGSISPLDDRHRDASPTTNGVKGEKVNVSDHQHRPYTEMKCAETPKGLEREKVYGTRCKSLNALLSNGYLYLR